VLHEDSRDAGADELGRTSGLDSGGHDEDPSPVSALASEAHEVHAVALPQVVVQQDDVHLSGGENRQRFLDRPAVRGDVEAGLGAEKPRHALPEQRVVVDEKDLDWPRLEFRH
jgi:hypothetical protein